MILHKEAYERFQDRQLKGETRCWAFKSINKYSDRCMRRATTMRQGIPVCKQHGRVDNLVWKEWPDNLGVNAFNNRVYHWRWGRNRLHPRY